MKRIFLVIVFSLSLFSLGSNPVDAETYEYPFDSIKITSALQFQVTLEEEPNELSILYGNVSLGETFTVYVGTLEFIFEGAEVEGSGSIMILTNSDDVDFARYLLNSMSVQPDDYINYGFGSWILIDPDIGVVKDLTGDQYEIGYKENTATSAFTFLDNLDTMYQMDENSFIEIENLDILISAYQEETE